MSFCNNIFSNMNSPLQKSCSVRGTLIYLLMSGDLLSKHLGQVALANVESCRGFNALKFCFLGPTYPAPQT